MAGREVVSEQATAQCQTRSQRTECTLEHTGRCLHVQAAADALTLVPLLHAVVQPLQALAAAGREGQCWD